MASMHPAPVIAARRGATSFARHARTIMCYGMGCPRERQGVGTCRAPWRCDMPQAQALPPGVRTAFYCPHCAAHERHSLLYNHSHRLRCPACGAAHTRATLRAAYQAEYDDLLRDAAWLRTHMINALEMLDTSEALRVSDFFCLHHTQLPEKTE